jgi:hypothetical protein
MDRRVGGSQIRFGCGGEEKNSQPLPGIESPIIQSVALSLCRLSYPGSYRSCHLLYLLTYLLTHSMVQDII